jgi:hypothetical protein
MSAPRPTRETMSFEEATVSNIWEIAAISSLDLDTIRLI